MLAFDLLKAFSLLFSLALFAASIYILFQTGWVRLRKDRFQDIVLKSNIHHEKAKKQWADIERHFFHGDDNDLKVAILDADKLLNEALRESGIRGNNLGDRLKSLKAGQVPNIDGLWQAHKLRNQIAHEPSFKIKRDVAERALTIYEETLKKLGAIH